MAIPFHAVKAAAPSFIEAFCRQYLPRGKRTGDWWVAPVPWRLDKNPSLGVKLSTAKWTDFAQGTHGDLTDLFARIENCSAADAATRLAAMMGVS